MRFKLLPLALLLLLAACSEGDGTASTNNLRSGNSATCEGGFTNCDPIGCIDTSTSVEHCGGCGISCGTAPNAATSCDGSCQLDCTDGFVDINDDLGDEGGDGCEYACTPSNDGVEVCDGADNDCNGEVDEGFEVGETCMSGVGVCARDGEVVCAGDGTAECDAVPRPAGDERCGDQLDNDCDGEVDEGDAFDAMTFYRDSDEDTWGDPDDSQTSCEQPDGYVDRAGDCDDTAPTVFENAVELCDMLDNDCDNEIDETFATKGEPCTVGLGVCERTGELVCSDDMTELACSVVPGMPTEMPESTCDDIDADCDGIADNGCDDDNDGWCDEAFTVTNATPLCGGGSQTGDCDDEDDTVYPAAPGLCDNKDNDCNSMVDELQPTSSAALNPYTIAGFTNPRTTAVLGPVASAPMSDGYCVVAYDQPSQTLRFVRYRPTGTSISQDLAITAGATEYAYLLDVAVIGDRCAAVYSEPDLSTVVLAEWDSAAPASGVTTLEVTSNGELDDKDRRAALGVGRFPDGSGGLAEEWVVAWFNSFTIGSVTIRNVQYRHVAQGLASQSSNIAISASSWTEGDIAVGPAIGPTDSFSTFIRQTASRSRVVTVDLASHTSETERTALEVANSDLFRPTLEAVGGAVYLAYLDTAADQLVMKEVAATHTFGRTITTAAAEGPARDYTNSALFGPGFRGSLFWYADTAGDIAYEVSGAATLTQTAFDHDAFTYLDGTTTLRHHLMSTRVVGDVVQFLVLNESKPGSPTLPAKDHSLFVAEFTCF